jgi:hypothetical protein
MKSDAAAMNLVFGVNNLVFGAKNLVFVPKTRFFIHVFVILCAT